MRIGFIVLLACSVMVGGCGGGPSTTPTSVVVPVPTTETFMGTLSAPQPGQVLAFKSHPFTVTVAGAVTITLTSTAPSQTIEIGVGVGTPTSTDPGCAITQGNAFRMSAGSSPISGTLGAGSYCLAAFDVGNLFSTDIDYSVTVVHP